MLCEMSIYNIHIFFLKDNSECVNTLKTDAQTCISHLRYDVVLVSDRGGGHTSTMITSLVPLGIQSKIVY